MSNEYGIIAGFLLPHPPVIVPEVGCGQEREAAVTLSSYGRVADEAQELAPDTVVVISPHAPLFSDYIYIYDSEELEGDFEQFGAPQAKLKFKQDSELRTELDRLLAQENLPGGSLSPSQMQRFNISGKLDHGVLVPLYYFSSKYRNFRLVAMSCSGLDMQRLYLLGELIRKAAVSAKRRVCVIASGDMSHKVNGKSPYGSLPQGEKFDRCISSAIEASDMPAVLSVDSDLRERAAECGYRSLVILLGGFDKDEVRSELFSAEAPFGIGYCVAEFLPTGKAAESAFRLAHPEVSRKDENPYVAVARKTLESFVRNRTQPSAKDFQKLKDNKDLFGTKAGVFVSLKKFGELRGCIGTTVPTQDCIAVEIIQNAVSAGTRDPRFEPVKQDELDFLEYSVDVLSPSVPCMKTELDPKQYGVIVRNGGRTGLLLPDLEGVDTVEDQLSIACKKAGIGTGESYDIYRFTVTRHKGPGKSDD